MMYNTISKKSINNILMSFMLRRLKVKNNLVVLFFLTLLMTSCDKFFIPENDSEISKFSEDESHEFGNNCMDCHHSAGAGEGWFSLAGSVKGDNKKATIELLYDTLSEPIHKIEVDELGNFYTTNKIDFSTPYTVGVRKKNDGVRYMHSTITVGQCNLCHGATTEVLNINW